MVRSTGRPSTWCRLASKPSRLPAVEKGISVSPVDAKKLFLKEFCDSASRCTTFQNPPCGPGFHHLKGTRNREMDSGQDSFDIQEVELWSADIVPSV